MSNDMRILKFETLINVIDDALDRAYAKNLIGEEFTLPNTSLAIVFDYDKLNDYGKIIIDRSSFFVCTNDNCDSFEPWRNIYKDISAFKDNKYKIEAAKTLVKRCRYEKYREGAFKFIFWAMVVLTVDKTDAEEHLSLICDFARMLKITDDEMEDMLMVIKILYHEEESGFEFKTETVPNIFSRVLCLYNN